MIDSLDWEPESYLECINDRKKEDTEQWERRKKEYWNIYIYNKENVTKYWFIYD